MATDISKQKKDTTAGFGKSISLQSAQRLFLLSLGTLFLAVILLAQAYRVEHRALSITATVPSSPVKKGELISMGAVQLRVDKTQYKEGESPFKAPAGKRYAIISIYIKNKSDKPVQVLPSNDIYLKDDSGELAYISSFNLDQPFRAGELSPGEGIKGDLSFLISQDGVYKLYVDAPWSGGVIPLQI